MCFQQFKSSWNASGISPLWKESSELQPRAKLCASDTEQNLKTHFKDANCVINTEYVIYMSCIHVFCAKHIEYILFTITQSNDMISYLALQRKYKLSQIR